MRDSSSTGAISRSLRLRLTPRARRLSALVLALAANVLLIPACLLLAPASDWTPPVLVLSIGALALVGCFNAIRLADTEPAFLDAEFVAALLAVVLLGPLPAICIWLAGEAAYMVLIPQRRVAHLANAASYGWAALTGALVLDAIAPAGVTDAVDPRAWLAVAAAGVALLSVNFAVTHGIVAIVLDGRRPIEVLRLDLVATAPATLLMIATGTVTAFLYMAVGIPALALFSATVFTPRLAGKSQRDRGLGSSTLEHSQAMPLYAEEIARAMCLEESDQLVVRDAARFIRANDSETPSDRLSDVSDGHRHGLVEALLYKGEHWDAPGGRPGAVGGEMIPLTSRILAVADAWACLTAGGYPRLTSPQAVDLLEAGAGIHFDPAVVAAAARLVARSGC